MKILLVVHTFFPRWRAGTEVYALNLARSLREHGNEVRLVCYEPREDAGKKLEALDELYEELPVHRISFNKNHPDWLLHEYFNPEVEDHLLDFFGRVRPDVVHVIHTMHLSAATLTAAQRMGLPIVCTAMDFWFICPTFRLLRVDDSICPGPINFLQCTRCYAAPEAKWKQRWLVTLARSDRVAAILRRAIQLPDVVPGLRSLTALGKMRHVIQRPQLVREILSRADLLIAPNQNTYNLLVQNGAIAQRMVLLGFGLPLPPEVRKRPSGTLRLGYVGTLDHAKGAHVILEAFRRLANRDELELVLYGDPRHYPDYYAWLKELAGSDRRIKFAGTFPNERLAEIFAEIDLLVIPSMWYENTPLILLSAFATKTPVIVSNLGSLADAVHHEQNGLIFEMGDSEDLARQIERVLADPALLERLRQGIQPVKGLDQHAQELLEIYATLSTHSASAPPRVRDTSISRRLDAIHTTARATEAHLSFCERLSFGLGLQRRVARFDDYIELFRCKLTFETARQINLRLVWRCGRRPDEDLVVFVHFLNEQERISFQSDHRFKHFLDGGACTDEIVAYSVPVRVPDQISPRSYLVRLGLWIPSEKRFLALTRVRGWRKDSWHGVQVGRVRVR